MFNYLGGFVTDIEIYDLAANVLSAINADVNESHYTEVDSELKINFGIKNEINASASVLSGVGKPKVHSIDITYLFLKTLYRDIEKYFQYMYSGIDEELVNMMWTESEHFNKMLSLTSENNCIQNTFISSITWVYFHELGHLSQDHGRIRGLYSDNEINIMSEMFIDGGSELTSYKSTLWHATELAADFFSTTLCVYELCRHFNSSNIYAAINFLSIGLPIVLFRLQGSSFYVEQGAPAGSHPNPLTRLELMAPLIYEVLSSPNTEERRKLVHICGVSVYSVSLFWTRSIYNEPIYQDHFMLHGIVNKDDILQYLGYIIPVWDEISKDINDNFNFGPKRMVLEFSDNLRSSVDSFQLQN